jgi:hypothetical protein
MKSLFTSSADATKISTTVKGLLMAILPLLIVWTGLEEATITPIIDSIVTIVFTVTSLISAGQIFYGLCRKVYLQRWAAGE